MARYEVRIKDASHALGFGSKEYEAEVVDTKRFEVIGKARAATRDEAERKAWERSAGERLRRGD